MFQIHLKIITKAWEEYCYFLPIVLKKLFLVMFIYALIYSGISTLLQDHPLAVGMVIIDFYVSSLLMFFCINIFVNEPMAKGISLFFLINYTAATFIIGILVVIGYAFFILPGILLSAMVFLYPLFLLKHNQKVIEAIKSSMKYTKGYLIGICVSQAIFAIIIISFLYLSSAIIGLIFNDMVITDSAVITTLFGAIRYAFQIVIMIYFVSYMVTFYYWVNRQRRSADDLTAS